MVGDLVQRRMGMVAPGESFAVSASLVVGMSVRSLISMLIEPDIAGRLEWPVVNEDKVHCPEP